LTMTKRFLRQDYTVHKRLKRKWRKPKGRQSKLRVRKGGSGKKVSIGYGKKKKEQPVIVKDLKALENIKGDIIISSGLGSRKVIMISKKAKEAGIKILNMKKVKKALKKEKLLELKKEAGKKKEEKKKEEKKKEEKKTSENKKVEAEKKETEKKEAVPKKDVSAVSEK
jgi:large subunit ribosomal protein L32e